MSTDGDRLSGVTQEEMRRLQLLGSLIESTDDSALLGAWLAYLDKISPPKPALRVVDSNRKEP